MSAEYELSLNVKGTMTESSATEFSHSKTSLIWKEYDGVYYIGSYWTSGSLFWDVIVWSSNGTNETGVRDAVEAIALLVEFGLNAVIFSLAFLLCSYILLTISTDFDCYSYASSVSILVFTGE